MQSRWRHCFHSSFYFKRPTEEAALRGAYDEIKSTAESSFLLLTGPEGAGKTFLANRVLKDLVKQQGGYFIRGKFDFLRRPVPYAAFVAAINDFTNMVIARGGEATDQIRVAIMQNIDNEEETGVLIRMIPSLERILGRIDKSSGAKEATGTQQRFVFVFQSFLRAVCSPEKPLVLLLDDLHYADDCSLDLLANIVADHNTAGLVVVGTGVEDDMSSESYLHSKLNEIKSKGHVRICHIAVPNLHENDISSLLAQTLKADPQQIPSLAKLVYQQTAGTFYYIIRFLDWLLNLHLLTIDEDSGFWSWDEDDILITIGARKADDYLVGIGDRYEPKLPEDVREMLKVAACLGPQLDERLLEYVLQVPVARTLRQAKKLGVLKQDETRRTYTFEHDKMQQAAYRLIPGIEKNLFHLEVGRRLWNHFNADEMDRHIFTLLSQMNIAEASIVLEDERVAVATLCFHAGTSAARSSSFRFALTYLELGINLLTEKSWQDNYDLTLSLHNAAAEMALCTTNLNRMEQTLESIFHNADKFEDKVQAYALKVHALGVRGRYQDAIKLGVEVLAQLGVRLCWRSNCFASICLIRETKRIESLLRGKSDEQLLRMPNISNDSILSCLKILHTIYSNAVIIRSPFTPFIALKSMQLTLEHGLSAFASVAFASYGMLIVNAFKDIENAFRYGKLGLVLLERFRAKEYLARVYFPFYACIYAWKGPSLDVIEPLLLAYKTGFLVGDIEGGSLCASCFFYHAISAGLPLGATQKELEVIRKTITSNRLGSLLFVILPSLQLVYHLVGLSNDPLTVNGKICDFDQALQDAIQGEHRSKILVLHLLRMMFICIFHSHRNAVSEITQANEFGLTAQFALNKILMAFFCGMIALARAREGDDARKNLRFTSRCLKELHSWRNKSPLIVVGKIMLLEAELASISGQNSLALEKYVCTIALGSHQGCTYLEALANERAARHFWALGIHEEGRPFVDSAMVCYQQWGAVAKCKMLAKEIDLVYSCDKSVPVRTK